MRSDFIKSISFAKDILLKVNIILLFCLLYYITLIVIEYIAIISII